MSILHEQGAYLDESPDRIFAVLDDLEHTQDWLRVCKSMEKLTEGETHVGTKVKYTYSERGKPCEMVGQVTARVPNERLTIQFTDASKDVMIDYRLSNTGTGSHVIHSVDVTPKSFMMKLMSGSIKGQLETQTATTMSNLRSYLARQ